MSSPLLPDDLAARLLEYELRISALEKGQLNSSSVRITPGLSANGIQNKGFTVLDGSGNERVRLGATDSDATPAAAQSLYGLSAKDANGLIRVLLGQTGSTPTYGLSTFDAAGVKRFTAGQINGSTDGAAAYDSSGNPIWDTTGLVQVVKRIGGGATSGQTQGFTTTPTNVTGSSGTFTLSRTGSVLVLSQMNFFTSGGTASYGIARMNIFNSGSASVGTSPITYHANGSGISASSPYVTLVNLAADTYTGWMQYYLDAGATTTFSMWVAQWDAFQLGN